MAAGHAALGLLDDAGYARLESMGARVAEGLRDALSRAGVRGCVQRVASMFTLFFGIDGATRLSEVEGADRATFRRFFYGMLERGFYLPPSPFEAAFISLAHTHDDLTEFLDAAGETLRAIGAS
jgi:glutamate-1-semialdehyde 2,1-aminomutase